jgi:hypothetical protein
MQHPPGICRRQIVPPQLDTLRTDGRRDIAASIQEHRRFGRSGQREQMLGSPGQQGSARSSCPGVQGDGGTRGGNSRRPDSQLGVGEQGGVGNRMKTR